MPTESARATCHDKQVCQSCCCWVLSNGTWIVWGSKPVNWQVCFLSCIIKLDTRVTYVIWVLPSWECANSHSMMPKVGCSWNRTPVGASEEAMTMKRIGWSSWIWLSWAFWMAIFTILSSFLACGVRVWGEERAESPLRVSKRCVSELVGTHKAGHNQWISPKSFWKSWNVLRSSHLMDTFWGIMVCSETQ